MRTKTTIFLASLSLGIFALPMTAVAATKTTPASQAQAQNSSAPAAESSDPGSNLSKWLQGWVAGLFGVVVGIVGLGAVAKRSVGEGLALLLVALIVGGFIVAPADMNTLTSSVWAKIAG
jgi:predicted lipid-binding transport protein (Tim44 family)